MSQKYYEYSHYKEQAEQGPQPRPPRGSHAPYLLVFQAIFYSFFHVSATGSPGGGEGRVQIPHITGYSTAFSAPLSQTLLSYL